MNTKKLLPIVMFVLPSTALLAASPLVPVHSPLLADAELLGNGDALSRALDHNVGRFLTRAEVFSALNRSKSAGTLKIRGELRSEDLQVDPAVRITVPDPRLQLLRASTDPRTGCTWFRFRATAEPKLLPFYTTGPHLEKRLRTPVPRRNKQETLP